MKITIPVWNSFHLRIAFCAALVFSAFSSCKSITEYDSVHSGKLIIFSSELEEIGSIPIDGNPGCIQAFPGHILIATKEGMLLLYDAESLEKIEEYQIGPAAVEGYSEMLYIPEKGSVYLIGAYGNIFEINLPECTVEDMFSVCPLPVHMVSGGENSESFYLVDGYNNRLVTVSLSLNTAVGFLNFDGSIRAIASHGTDSILVSTSEQTRIVLEIAPGLIASLPVIYQGADCLAMILRSEYSSAIYNGYMGVISISLDEVSGSYVWGFSGECPIEGIPVKIKCDDIQHCFAVTYSGDGSSTLYSYDYSSGSINQQVELEGFPLDMDVSPNGNVYLIIVQE